MLARTRIQRCQPSVVSRARAACSMRSRSALRRASRSSSVSGLRLKRRAIVGSFRAWGPPRWRADPPPPARPPGRATIGWRVGPPAGGARLRGLVEVLVELVADAVVRLGLGLALGALQLADRGLGLVVGGVGALDGLLELASATRGRAGRRASSAPWRRCPCASSSGSRASAGLTGRRAGWRAARRRSRPARGRRARWRSWRRRRTSTAR